MNSGGGGGGQVQQVQPAQMTPAPQANLQTTGYGGMGYYSEPNPFTQGTTPSWMTGHFSAPWWGMGVMGNPLTQDQLQAPAPAPSRATPPEEIKASAPSQSAQPPYSVIRDQMKWEDSYEQAKADGRSGGAYVGLWNPDFSPMARWERQRAYQANQDYWSTHTVDDWRKEKAG